MNRKNPSSQIARLSFISAIAFYAFVRGLLVNITPTWLRTVMELASSFGVYEAVYDLLYLLYNKHFYRIFDRSLNFQGEWYQVFIVSEYKDPLKGIRHGPVKISASPDSLALSGENYRLDGSFSSSWQSEFATINGDKMVLLYVSEGTHRERSITRGIMVFHIYGTPPSRLVGSFTDAAPATHSGPMYIFREKTEYEKRLEELQTKARVTEHGKSVPSSD